MYRKVSVARHLFWRPNVLYSTKVQHDVNHAKSLPNTVLLVGGPGSGKTTHGVKLAEKLDATFISTGVILRDYLSENEGDSTAEAIREYMVKGECAPPELTDAVFRTWLQQKSDKKRLVIEGYPRLPEQIDSAAQLLRDCGYKPVDAVIVLHATRDLLMQRVHGRSLSREDDDTASVRIKSYLTNAKELLAPFHSQDLIIDVQVDKSRTVVDVAETIWDSMQQLIRGEAPVRISPADELRALLHSNGGIVGHEAIQRFRDRSLTRNHAHRTGVMRRFVYCFTDSAQKMREWRDMLATYGLECLSVPHLSDNEWNNYAQQIQPDSPLLAKARQDIAQGVLPSVKGDESHARELDDDKITGLALKTLFIRQLLSCKEKGLIVPVAVMREQSALLAPSVDDSVPPHRLSTGRDGVHAVNRATVCMWRQNVKSNQLQVQTFQSFTRGKILWDHRDPADPSVFGWDDVFVPEGIDVSLHELAQRGLKVAARQNNLSEFLVEFIHYAKGPRDLRWNPQAPTRCVDFEIDAADAVARNPYVTDVTVQAHGAAGYVQRALDMGLYFRFPFNRRHANYFFTPVSGLPVTPKKDAVHEHVFQSHDIGHILIAELIFTGHDSYENRTAYLACRMLSEAMTMVLADMFVVDSLVAAKREGSGSAARAIPDDYDWNKRMIYPLFKACGLSLVDDIHGGAHVENLFKLMQANTDCLIKGDDSGYLSLIEQANSGEAGLRALHEFKEKYVPFFCADYSWTVGNYDALTGRSAAHQRWWSMTKRVREESGLLFESAGDFVKKELANVDIDDSAAVVDKCLRVLYDRRIAPTLKAASVTGAADNGQQELVIAPQWLRTGRSAIRYFVGQMAAFAHFAFVPSATEHCLEVERVVLEMIGYMKEASDDSKEAQDKILAFIASGRATVETFLDTLFKLHLITSDDQITWREQFPVFPVRYLTYDHDPSTYEHTGDIFRREFDRNVRAERMVDAYAHATGAVDLLLPTTTQVTTLQVSPVKSRAFVKRMQALVEGAGGIIDAGAFVTQPGVTLLAESCATTSTMITDPRKIAVSFLIAGVSVETAFEFTAHKEAHIARLTSSRTAAMQHPLIRLLPHHDAESQKSYYTRTMPRRQRIRALLRPGTALAASTRPDLKEASERRGKFELDNTAAPSAKATAFVVTMTLEGFHNVLLGRCSREGNEVDVIEVACLLADALHAKYPDIIAPAATYRDSLNTEKYAASAASASQTDAADLETSQIVSELRMTPHARSLFRSLNLNVSPSRNDTDIMAEFCTRLTYLSFPVSSAYDPSAFIDRVVVGSGHLSVVACSMPSVFLAGTNKGTLQEFFKECESKIGGSVTVSDKGMLLTFSVKAWAKVLNAARIHDDHVVIDAGVQLTKLLQPRYGAYLAVGRS